MSKHLFSDIRIPIEPDNPSIRRIEDKCIKCGQCRQVCEEVGKRLDFSKKEGITCHENC